MSNDSYFPEVFDSSMLATFKSCPAMFKLIYIDQWKSKEPSVHLHAGGAFAKGVEVARRAFFEEGFEADDAVAAGLRALIQFYGTFDCPPDSAKSLERTAGALEYYFDRYPLSNYSDESPITLPGGKRGIEFSFAHPLDYKHPATGNPLIYCGRMDAIQNFAGGIYKFDEKTTSSLGPTWSRQWDLRSQFIGYEWGCRQAGIRTQGVVVRGISILKTKYDTQQAIINHSDWMVERWYDELHWWLDRVFLCWSTNKWVHNLDHACAEYGGCGFRSVCLSSEPAPWLDTYFERRHWDPITRVEVKL